MPENFTISVITPSFNSAKYLEEAINSVINQGITDFEHIVVDGGSSDGTVEILRKYPHLIWVSEPDRGQSDAMNKGLGMSRGQIICYLNADDYFLPGAFKTILPYFSRGADFVVGNVLVISAVKTWINNPKVGHDEMLRHWEQNAFCVNPVGYFYRREVQENSPGFNGENHYAMDLEFLLDCSRKYNFTKISEPDPLGVFRLHDETKTSQSSKKESVQDLLGFYSFIDKYLERKPAAFTENFKKDQLKAYERRIDRQNNIEKGNSQGSMSRKKSRFRLKLNDFLKSKNKTAIVVNYIKRKF